MKYIKKFQQGGYLQYTWTPSMPPTGMPGAPQGASGTSSSSTSSGSGSDDWLDKDLKKELLKGGLANDVNAVYSQLSKINGASTNAFLDPNNRQLVYALGAQINELQRNKDMWVKSYGIAEGAGGLNEIAVGNSGEIYVKDSEGIIKGISVAQYKRRPQLYQTLSVAELLEKRNTDAQLTNNNDVFNVVNNAIGIKNITSDIQKIITALGTEKTSETSIYDRDALKKEFDNISYDIQMTGRSMTDSERKGFAILNTLMSSPSRYNEIMSSESTNRNHLDKAVSYIWSTMSDAAQRKLTAQAALNNTSVEQIITSAAIQFSGHSTQINIKPISEAQAKTGSSSGDVKGPPMSPIELFMDGTLYTGNHIIYNDPDVNAKLQGTMTGTMAMVSPDNKTITPTTMSSFLMTGWETLIDSTQIQFGSKKVKTTELKDIILDGHSNIARAYLPVDANGNVNNAMLDLFSELMGEYNNNKDKMTKKEVDELFRFNGFNVTVNDDKSLDVTAQGDRVKPFLITHGYTKEGSNLVKDNTDVEKGGLWELDKESSKDMKTFENSAWSAGKDDSKGSLGPKQGFFGRMTGTDRYKGIIYMPIREGANVTAAAVQGNGPRRHQYTEEDVMHLAQNTTPSFNSQNGISNLEK